MNNPFVLGSLAWVVATMFTIGALVVFTIEPSPIKSVVVIGIFVIEIFTLDKTTW